MSDNMDKKRNNGGIKFRQTKKKGGPKKGADKNDYQWKRGGRTAIVWMMFLVIMLVFYQFMDTMSLENEQLIEYSDYRMFLENDKIQSGELVGREFKGELKQQETIIRSNNPIPVTRFKVVLPEYHKEIEAEWRQYGVDYNFKQKDLEWSGILLATLPWIVIILVWIYFFRRMQSGGGGSKGIFSFGKSRAKLLIENKPKITFDNVAGCDEAKVELQEIIEFLKAPERFEKLGGKIPKGAILIGPPGTGKTLLARAVAGEAEVPFFSISGADFVEMFVGVGASRVRDLFEQGKKNAPCIIFIDEIDAVGRARGAGLGGGHDEREQTLNALLVEMDGFEHNEGVILVAATNRPDVLDSALMRPGRFDRQIVVDRPDVRGREGILRVHTKNIPLDAKVDLKIIAKGTPGMSGADLANIVNEGALLAARKNSKKVEMDDIEQAKDKIMMGMERKTMVISEEEKRSTAYHEAGHVLVSKFIPESDPIHKVTIIPRGRALGVTHSLPIDERHTYSKSYCEAMIAKLMGGRAAEKIIFNHYSTGAGNDIETASALARKMVCNWGMSMKLGPQAFGKKEEEIFLGRDIATHRDFSEKTAQLIDQEIRKIIDDQERRAEKIIRDNLGILKRLSEALLKKEILNTIEIDRLIKGEDIFLKSEGEKGNGDTPKGFYKAVKEQTKSSHSNRRPPRSTGGRSQNTRPVNRTDGTKTGEVGGVTPEGEEKKPRRRSSSYTRRRRNSASDRVQEEKKNENVESPKIDQISSGTEPQKTEQTVVTSDSSETTTPVSKPRRRRPYKKKPKVEQADKAVESAARVSKSDVIEPQKTEAPVVESESKVETKPKPKRRRAPARKKIEDKNEAKNEDVKPSDSSE